MGTQQSTSRIPSESTQQSTSRIPSESNPAAGESAVQPFLTHAEYLLQQSQKMTAEDAPLEEQKKQKSLQFNHGQCRYLVKKLEMAVESARESMSLSSPRESSEVDVKDWKLVGKWKFLVRLAMDVHRFIEECWKEEYWIQAASMLINAFEHVVSLDSHLELCIWSFKRSGRIILETALKRELISISEAHDDRTGELEKLLKRTGVTLKLESFGNLQGYELAASLLGKLEPAFAEINPGMSLAELSVHDLFVLLKRVVATGSPGSFSGPEEQIATSLAPRFLASVGDPFSDKTDIDFMKVDCASLGQERKVLGRGSFGKVYRVQWLGLPAAEKVLLPRSENSEDLWPDFVKEVSILARQSHPNIVRLLCYGEYVPKENEFKYSMMEQLMEIYGKGVPKENLFKYSMVQELMETDLTKLIEKRMISSVEAPFSLDEVVDILLQIAEGMDYLRRRKVLHKDLKALNILVKCEMCRDLNFEFILAKVADFGISKTKERTITVSHPTWNVGTSKYLAPELISFTYGKPERNPERNSERNPFKCDVYSFGMLCYEVLTGKTPFANELDGVAKKMVLRGERPDLPREYPFCLRRMIHKCWRGEPEERPTFAEICRELRFMKGALLIGWDL